MLCCFERVDDYFVCVESLESIFSIEQRLTTSIKVFSGENTLHMLLMPEGLRMASSLRDLEQVQVLSDSSTPTL